MSYKPKTFEESFSEITAFRMNGQLRYEIRMVAMQADRELKDKQKEIDELKALLMEAYGPATDTNNWELVHKINDVYSEGLQAGLRRLHEAVERERQLRRVR